jgi:predicted PurR-regulated permease PerM
MEQQQSANKTLVLLLTIAVSIYLIEKIGQAFLTLSNILLLLALAWLLAFSLRPLVLSIERLSTPAWLLDRIKQRWGEARAQRFAHPSYGFAIFAVYFMVLAVIVVVVLALVPLIVEQINQLADTIQQGANNLPEGIQRVTEFINSARDFLVNRLQIDPSVITLPQPEQLVTQITSLGSNLLQFGLNLVAGIAATLGQFLLIVFLSLLVMIDGSRLVQELIRLVPNKHVGETQFALDTLDRTFGGFLGGTLLQSVIYGLVVIFLMSLLGIGSAAVVGIATGILMLIPIVGGPIGLVIPLLVGLLQSSPNTLLLILLLAIFQVVLFNFITPRLLSRSLRMPSLLVIVSLLIGFWGFVFAVPIAAAIYSVGLVLLEQAKRQHDQSDQDQQREKALD